jgi:hypothetical protein
MMAKAPQASTNHPAYSIPVVLEGLRIFPTQGFPSIGGVGRFEVTQHKTTFYLCGVSRFLVVGTISARKSTTQADLPSFLNRGSRKLEL